MTCSSSLGHAVVTLDANDTSLAVFVNTVLIKEMGLSSPMIDVANATIYEHGEFENLASEKLGRWTREGRVDLRVTDGAQEVEWTVTVTHEPTTEDAPTLFRVAVATHAAVKESADIAPEGEGDTDAVTSYNPRTSKRGRPVAGGVTTGDVTFL